MNPRERVFTALQHQEPDRVPRFEIWIDALRDELGVHFPQHYAWGSHVGVYCLKLGKRGDNAVDQAGEVDTQDRDEADKREFLCCTECQYPITWQTERININEKHQHVFANLHGYIYQIGCFARAPGCIPIGDETSHFSWFPGYTWRIALCGQCVTLLGWAFSSPEIQFFGLILDKLSHHKL